MTTSSILLLAILKIYTVINHYYENSVCYRIFCRLEFLWQTSAIYRFFCIEDEKQYGGGSHVLALADRLINPLWVLWSRITRAFVPFFEGSVASSWVKHSRVCAFLRLEVLLGLFFFGMAVVHHNFWNNRFIMLAAVFFLAAYVLRHSLVADKITAKELCLPLIFYAATACISLAVSLDSGDSLRVMVIFLSCLLICQLTPFIINTRQKFNTALVFLFLGLFATSMFGLFQYHRGIEVRAAFMDFTMNHLGVIGRVYSTMDNPNNFAEYIIMLLPVFVAFIFNLKSDVKRVAFCILLAPALPALILTQSRASYLCLMAGAVVYVWMIHKRLVPVMAAAVFVSVPLWPPQVMARLMTIGRDTSSAFRVMIWNASLDVLRDIWATGLGLGPISFRILYQRYVNSLAYGAMHSHNLFLQIWIGKGIMGITAFLVLMFVVFKKLVIVCKNTKNFGDKHFAAGFIASLTAILGFGMVEYVWFYPRVLLTFWIIVGLALAHIKICQEDLCQEERS